jgi:hypothetical protein
MTSDVLSEEMPEIRFHLPDGAGLVTGHLIAIEDRPGGFFWLQVRVALWYRRVQPSAPFTDSVEATQCTIWIPIDAVVSLENASYAQIVVFLGSQAYSKVPRLNPGEGRPPDSPRYPMPWEHGHADGEDRS